MSGYISLGKVNVSRKLWYSCMIIVLSVDPVSSRSLQSLRATVNSGLHLQSFVLSDSSMVGLNAARPLFSFLLDGQYLSTSGMGASGTDTLYQLTSAKNFKIQLRSPSGIAGKCMNEIIFENSGSDTVTLSNIVPFGEDKSSVYITGYGPPDLARAYLFRPGLRPLRVILPDNAWELGYSSFQIDKELSVCAIARRQRTEGGLKRRYETILPPGAKVIYYMYSEIFTGEWQQGLRLLFRDRYLYDLGKFDNSLYERSDLSWIKESYLIFLQMAWDREFFDRLTGKYNYAQLLKSRIEQFGAVDVFGIWPTWPRLGLDQRNQWDLYRDLPGGIAQIKNFAGISHLYGTKFFIAYNPWDNSTRKADHFRGMATLISETDADGVFLDTRGSSSPELQAAADSVRKGVVMYSEGMAVIKDMPGIISGRVHNAIFYSPELNLNKLIKPDFAIFRVCDVGEDIIHREVAISFFNGYGTELYMFRPGGRDENYIQDMEFLARTTFTLRQNNDAFLDFNWTPLIETNTDNVFVNKWNSGEKTIFTILNMKYEGVDGKLFRVSNMKGKHYVSIWNHENLIPEIENGYAYIPAKTDGWSQLISGTRKEGSVDCIAEFPDILKSVLTGDSVRLASSGKGKTVIWKGNPSYKTAYKEFRIINDTVIRINDLFGFYEGKIVVQLIENKRLKDENVLTLKGGKPWMISRPEPTKRSVSIPQDMVLVPGTDFSFEVSTTENFIPYPDVSKREVPIDSFLIDKYPVTNARYYDFIVSSGYRPSDTTRYLRHWQSGIFKQGQDGYPVVYVSIEDMNAYARWAGKRLPSEAEWQLAAQGTDQRKWPWGSEFHGTYCNNAFDRPTPVDAFSKGQSPYGAFDMVGNVWQMTGDMYFNGTNYFAVIRGGSYYRPESSWWYLKGGPQALDKTQIMLLVSQGFDRSATVGFRCVMDVDRKNFKDKRQK